ncbi:hypothetical protein IWZ01DRAFT_528004 [Phyllosticta capitalensis]
METDEQSATRKPAPQADLLKFEIPQEIDRPNVKQEKKTAAQTYRTYMAMCYQQGYRCDLAIKFTDGQVLRAHKSVLCKYSDVFKKAINGGFQDSQVMQQESKTDTVEISHEDTEAVLAMIQWMYNGTRKTPGEQSSLYSHIRLYAAADYYQVQKLKKETTRCVLHEIRDELKDSEGASMPEAIELIFSSTPDSDRMLRDAVRLPNVKEIEVADFWQSLCLGVDERNYDPAVVLRVFQEFECCECKTVIILPYDAEGSECPDCEDEFAELLELGRVMVRRI